MLIKKRLGLLVTGATAAIAIAALGATPAGDTEAAPSKPTVTPGEIAAVQLATQVQPLSTRDYQHGYQQGYRQAFRDGYNDGRAACHKRPTPHSHIQSQGDFERGYADGYERGYNYGFALGCHSHR